ncbi:MAG: hypothetical protein LBJ19_00325 [Holosporaceae bacterium]|jgi:DNA polymerase III delta prime subunit|nr:hypothetical protein [Holosporaceae bacterium]
MLHNEIGSHKIFGHEKIESALAGSIRSGKIFPTWVFNGPVGVGKFTMANRFARCLLSETIPSGDVLDVPQQHPVHKLVETRTHPDLFILEDYADAAISIENIRQLMVKFKKMPALSRHRVLLLNGAENLNRSIHNSLLKALEEPPAYSVIIMICCNVGSMPKTLLSRSARMNFHPLEISMVQSYLENTGVSNAHEFAKLSGGSIGYALQLQHNNGIIVWDILNHIFHSNSLDDEVSKNITHLMDTYTATHFPFIKECILRIMYDYSNMLLNNMPASVELDVKIAKIMDIISMLQKAQRLLLDKNVVLAYVFENFFSIC